MVLDILPRAERYTSLHPSFARAFAFLQQDLTRHPAGRHEIDGERLFVSIDQADGRGRRGARLEAHQRYIDIQFTIDGHEAIGWKPRAECRLPDGGFDPGRDIQFFRDIPAAWLPVPAGHFAIFFPDDVHAPLGGAGSVKKAIVKIAILEVS